MSKTLAPIHSGLYKKIMLFENIEKLIVKNTQREQGHQILVERFGDYLPNEPLEDIIDHNNIHGWLQNRITIAEKRQASLIFALMNSDTKLLEIVKEVYRKVGKETSAYFNAKTAVDAFTALNQVLLEGMPCDRVNKVMEQSEEQMQWQTVNCVHKDNWDSQGVDVDLFYKFREAFALAFVTGLGEAFMYKYSNEFGQIHSITMK